MFSGERMLGCLGDSLDSLPPRHERPCRLSPGLYGNEVAGGLAGAKGASVQAGHQRPPMGLSCFFPTTIS